MKKPTKGDLVEILVDDYGQKGQVGEIEIDDHSGCPYRVNGSWYTGSDVKLVEESPHPAKRELHIGDKVRVKSREWYEANIDPYGCVKCGELIFLPEMAGYCGREVQIECLAGHFFGLKGIGHLWTAEMFDLDEPPKESVPIRFQGIHEWSFFGRGKSPIKMNIPLIKTNKLLTNIKLD